MAPRWPSAKPGALRPACPACDFVLYLDPKVVVAVAVGHAGRVLLGRRAINPGRGLWSFPGGYVDRGEAVEDAALRETREETGLAVRLTGLLGVYSAVGRPHVVLAYAATAIGDPAALRPNPKRCWSWPISRPPARPRWPSRTTRRFWPHGRPPRIDAPRAARV